MNHIEVRGEVVYRRTYSRPFDMQDDNSKFETWEGDSGTVARVIEHQSWLWMRALGRPLNSVEIEELAELQALLLGRTSSVSGRTLWLGGTEVAKTREASQFNCSGLVLNTVSDAVDQIWLLMQGCGVGFHPEPGTLNGFTNEISEIEVIRSEREEKGGEEQNTETVEGGTWTIRVGDSAEAWSKAFGKVLSGKHRVSKLVFDLSQIRPAGKRLNGYGWISSGDASLSVALPAIAEILNRKTGKLLSAMDLLDVGNWMGTVLSSRRSAEIAFHRFGEEGWEDFADAKKDRWELGEGQRDQSNNSLLFYHKPSRLEIYGLFTKMIENGGGEPGFINALAALLRAPWFKLLNPCAEILLGNKSFCNLVETNLSAYNGRLDDLLRTIYIIGRANYRQTCVDLRDGILQDTWHELNEYLRLTGIGVTGIVGWEYAMDKYVWQTLRDTAHDAVNSMADELGLPRSKAVTTIKPSGTLSKMMGCTEGIHMPLGKYIFNHINFGKHDPLIPKLRGAGYRVWDNPSDPEGVLVTFPVCWDDLPFERVWNEERGMFFDINTESAVSQLNRYKMVMDNYVDHNCSITISYSPKEVPEIVDWLDKNWDAYVGVSWLLRADPTKTAADLGQPYLPQEVVTEERYEDYIKDIREVDLSNTDSFIEMSEEACSVGGSCPIK